MKMHLGITCAAAIALGGVVTLMQPEPAAAQDDPFGYACVNCPANWSNLNIANNNCSADGQSPIAFAKATASKKRLVRLRPQFGESNLKVLRPNTTNFEAEIEEEFVTRVGDTEYNLIQFHFHSASEHVVDGDRYPLEMHFVHASDAGALAVIGVFIKEGDELDAIEPLIEELDEVDDLDVGEEIEVESVNVAALLPRKLKSFRYTGSTTTPSCTELVTWILLDRVIEMSAEQIAAIQAVIRDFNGGFDNNRPIQNLNGRTVITDSRTRSDDDDDDGGDDDDD